jgi:hypothetical protein
MPNDPEPETIERDIDTNEVIELLPENNDAPWASFEVACTPLSNGVAPTWTIPDIGAGGVKGYRVVGATLGKGTYKIRVRFLGLANGEVPTRTAAILKIT